jgi:hypothetical protein
VTAETNIPNPATLGAPAEIAPPPVPPVAEQAGVTTERWAHIRSVAYHVGIVAGGVALNFNANKLPAALQAPAATAGNTLVNHGVNQLVGAVTGKPPTH